MIIGMGGEVDLEGLAAQEDFSGCNLLSYQQIAKETRFLQISQKVPREMTEEHRANERAMAEFVKTLRDDLMKVFETGLLPVAYFITFREPSAEEYETMRFVAHWTGDCPAGLDKVLDEVLHRWLGENCKEFIPVSDMPKYKQ